MSETLLHWWPVLVALVAVVAMFVDIRSQSKQTREDLSKHREESAKSAEKNAEKMDTVVRDPAAVKTDVAVLKARDEWEANTKPALTAIPGTRK